MYGNVYKKWHISVYFALKFWQIGEKSISLHPDKIICYDIILKVYAKQESGNAPIERRP